jgi:predicted Zn-dependent peptidase
MMRSLRLLAGIIAFATILCAQLKLPPYLTRTLPNGVTVYVMKKTGVPLVNIDVAIRGGKESEPANLTGIASITADLLRKGTTAHSASEISEELDALGGSYRNHTDEQSTLLETEFLAKDFNHGLSVVAETLLHPTFPQSEVVKLLGQRRDDIRSLKDNPRRAISAYAHAFFFGPDHPYGRIVDEQSLRQITRDGIEQYYQRMYTAPNLIVTVVGDIDPAAVVRQLDHVFAPLHAGAPYAWKQPIELKPLSTCRMLLVDKPASTQTYFYVMQPGIDARNPDRAAIRLVNTVFGGTFASLLNEQLRIKTGLTYGARSSIDRDRLQGMNAIETFTKTASTARALTLSVSTLKALHENGITAAQLASAKAYLKGTLPRSLETGSQLANQLIRLNVLGLDRDEVDDLFQRLDAVTLEQANAAAKKYYQPGGLTFVLIGDVPKFKAEMTKFAPHPREISITQLGFN